jgi:hypothetical protein
MRLYFCQYDVRNEETNVLNTAFLKPTITVSAAQDLKDKDISTVEFL